MESIARRASRRGEPWHRAPQARRRHTGVLAALHGEVRPSAIVVDDILETGGRLISCCRELRR
jgi:hypothetical protein